MRIEQTVINIRFDAAKGTASLQSREGILGERIGTLPIPTRQGYAFSGWYLGEERVDEDTVIRSAADIRLTARWEKKQKQKGDRRNTMLRRQQVIAIVLAAVIVVLAVALVFAKINVGIYTLKDTYLDESGNEQVVRYTIKKDKTDNGLYALYNKAGEKMAVVEDNGFNNYTSTSDGVIYRVYETDVSGNQYRINTSTGSYETYAVVDTEGDEVLGGTVVSTRVMMFPRIRQAETYSVEVSNEYGSYKIYRKTIANTAEDATTAYKSVVTVASKVWDSDSSSWVWQDSPATYEPTLYASLCVGCGYSLTMQKLDFSDPATPRKEDGSINYEAYGLHTVTDEHGEVDYSKSPAVYTIIKGESASDGSFSATDTSYTVYIGDAIVSGGGYYAKRADRDTVYIVSSDISNTVLQPVESMVTPQLIYPMTVSTYTMVEDFVFAQVDTLNPPTGVESVVTPITQFSYIDLTLRENTIYSSVPYWTTGSSQLLKGYQLNSDSVNTVLYNLYSMQYLACKKLSPTAEEMKQYGLQDNVWLMSFQYDPDVAKGGSGQYVLNSIVISQKTYDEALGQDVYYIYSGLFDMIVAVDPYFASFVEWEQSRWYNHYFYQNNIAYVREMHYTIAGKQYDFILDNSATDQTGNVSSDALVIYCPQYTGNEDHILNYTIRQDEKTDTGTTKTKEYTAIDNFRRFYAKLLWYTIEGDVNEAAFRAATGMSVAEFIASDTNDDKAIARISFRVEDYASVSNTATDEDGNKFYTENNSFDSIIRFYTYGSDGNYRKLLLTIEVADSYDADGNPIFDATKAQGNFYVLSSPLSNAGPKGIAEYAEDLLNEVLIPSST